jgi:hypothetical protein
MIEDRPIWLTSLADADRDASAPDTLEPRLEAALRRRRSSFLAKRAGSIGLAAALVVGLWLAPKHPMTPPSAVESMDDDGLSDVMADAGDIPGEDGGFEGDFVPTKLASEQPLESVRVVRVSMPGAALAHYGVPTPSEVSATGEVTADLLLGQDGIARAVRVVK